MPDEFAMAPAEDGRLDNMIDGPEARHPRESAFRLLNEGTEAFVVRM